MSMDALAVEIHKNARAKGFYNSVNLSFTAEKIALIHSEVSEVLEAMRDDDRELMQEELADVIIRVLDLAEYNGMSMDEAVSAKMAKNLHRPYLHGKQF